MSVLEELNFSMKRYQGHTDFVLIIIMILQCENVTCCTEIVLKLSAVGTYIQGI